MLSAGSLRVFHLRERSPCGGGAGLGVGRRRCARRCLPALGGRRGRAHQLRPRIGPLQVLHLGENVAEMLAVLAALAEPGIGKVPGPLERRLGENLIDARRPGGAHLGEARRDAARRHVAVELVLLEQLRRVAPQPLERGLHPRMALRRTVAQAHQPARAVAQMIAGLLHRLRRDGREALVRRVRSAARRARAGTHRSAPGARCVSPKSPFGCSTSVGLRYSPCSRRKARSSSVRPAALHLARVAQQQAGLSDEIERHVGEPQILLEHGSMSDPFPEPLPENQAEIAEPQGVAAERRHAAERVRGWLRLDDLTAHVRRDRLAAHNVFTSSGMS